MNRNHHTGSRIEEPGRAVSRPPVARSASPVAAMLPLFALIFALMLALGLAGTAHAQQEGTAYEPAPYAGQTADPSPGGGVYEAPEYGSSSGGEQTSAAGERYDGATSGRLAETGGPPRALLPALGAYLILVGAAVYASGRRSNGAGRGLTGTRD